MVFIPGASSWGHLWPLRHSWLLLAGDYETRFLGLVSGTLQYTEDKISSAVEQTASQWRP